MSGKNGVTGQAVGAESAFGKYFLITVPDFTGGTGAHGPMTSYLRLGAIESASAAASPSAPLGTGEDLAARVTSFIDDTRLRDGCPDFVSEAERQAETAVLHTKGGWRDHTDGNRITTTRGDKVEVIKGNYRMVVLGRREDEAGWDVSGGHVGETGITYDGASVIEYSTEEYNGTWIVVEHTRKGHVHTAYHGKVYTYHCGEIVETITGSETPDETQPNPVVTEQVWAESLTSQTGSILCPVPEITNTTYVDLMESTTYAGSMADSTIVAGDQTSSTEVAGVVDSTTTAAAVNDTTVAASVTNTTVGNSFTTIIGSEAEVVVGNMMEVTVGAQESVTIGAVLELTVALMMDVCIAGRVSVDIGPRVEVSAGSRTEISLAKQNVAASRVEANGVETKTSGIYTRLSGLTLFM